MCIVLVGVNFNHGGSIVLSRRRPTAVGSRRLLRPLSEGDSMSSTVEVRPTSVQPHARVRHKSYDSVSRQAHLLARQPPGGRFTPHHIVAQSNAQYTRPGVRSTTATELDPVNLKTSLSDSVKESLYCYAVVRSH